MPNPPGQMPASARADYSRMNPLTYRDPTGDTAVRNLLQGGGPFQITAENGFRIWVNKETLQYMLLGTEARVSRGGKLWIDPIDPAKKNTPAAVEFGDMNSSRGSTATPTI